MRLWVAGFLRRTSGSAQPFEERSLHYERLPNVEERQELPWLGSSFTLKEAGEDYVIICVEVEGSSQEIRLQKGETQTITFERNIVALEIAIKLER